MQRRTGLILTVIAALASAGCLGSTGGATQSQGARRGAITGTLWMIGGPPPGHRRLRDTGIRVLADGRAVARTTTDQRGRFRVALAPGRYQLVLTDGNELLPRHVDVTANETTRLTLSLSVR